MAMKHGFLTAFSIFLLCLLGVWSTSSAQAGAEAGIRELDLQLEGNQALISLRLENAFNQEFQQRIESGLPTDLTFRFVLERDRRTWFDKTVARGSLQVIAMYNAVTSEYLVNFKKDGNLIESRVLRDQEELRSAMTELSQFPMFSMSGRDPQERLQLRVRAELGTRMFLAFIPRTVATDWAKTQPFRIRDLNP